MTVDEREPGSAPESLTPDADTGALREAQAKRVRRRRMLALATLASTLVLGSIGWWTHHSVELSMRSTRGAALKSVLDSETQSLRVWIDDQKHSIGRLARNRQLRELVELIAGDTAAGGVIDCGSARPRRLVSLLDESLDGAGAAIFNVVVASGDIVASSFTEYCGLRYNDEALASDFAPAFAGKSLFVPPHRDPSKLVQAPASPPVESPLIWIRSPVRSDSDEIIAVLGVGYLAEARFSTILAAARAGDSDEVYAFDRDGVILSNSRFEAQLSEFAILPEGSSAVGRLVLRAPRTEQTARTRLVEAALASDIEDKNAGGMLLDPYPGYLAAPVVGGWRWLAEDGIFVAIEMSAEEAYAPLETLDRVFAVVFGVMILAVCVALFYWFTAVLIRAEVEKDRMGPYWLAERIGEGGIGNVYHARHDLLKRPSAVKLLKPTRATDEMTARFRREAKLASQLTHPNMIEIYDYGIGVDGTLFYAMELLDGDTVGELVVRNGPMPVARVAHLMRQVCAGLAEAHGKGLVHRDVSITNIMACLYGGEYDFVKILDFGLVKSMVEEQSQVITRAVRILGTVQYMAPERLHDPAGVDVRADVYAVGGVTFFLASGHRMFEVEDTVALTSRVINETPPRLSEVAEQPIPPELDDLVAACLAKDRNDRPSSIHEVKAVLDRIAEHERWTQSDARAAWEARHRNSPTPN